MTQFSVSDRLASGRKRSNHGAIFEKSIANWPLRSPVCSVLRAIGVLWRNGGGDFGPEALARDFAVFLTDDELEACVDELVDAGTLTRVAGNDEIDEYELTDRGVRLANQLEWMLSREMSRDD